ncbi:unnamed protein product, partial [Rotaria magnacalcarata]
MMANGLIEPSRSQYNSPVMFVRKRPTYTPDGTLIPAKLRLILDLRQVNIHSKIFNWPIPSVDSILQQLSGFKTFISSDLINGYYQTIVHPDSRKVLAFTLPTGKYQLTRMPMGHVNSAMIFTAAVSKALGHVLRPMAIPVTTTKDGISSTEVVSRTRAFLYIDDAMGGFESHAVLLVVLKAILKRMVKFNLKWKVSKVKIAMKSVSFLGHLTSIDKEGDMTTPPQFNNNEIIQNYCDNKIPPLPYCKLETKQIPINLTTDYDYVKGFPNDGKNIICKHVSTNLSITQIYFSDLRIDPYCCLWDTGSSINLISTTMSDKLWNKKLSSPAGSEEVNIAGSGDIIFGIMPDDKMPACVILSFNMMSRHGICLNYDSMMLQSFGEDIQNMGRIGDEYCKLV